MVPPRTDPIDACFDALERAIERDPALSRELSEGRKEFLGPGRSIEDDAEAALAERRLLEWFLLEKERSGADERRIAVLVATIVDRCAAKSGESPAGIARALAESHASIFEVAEVDADGAVHLWDLAGLFECTALEPDGSRLLERGDLIAGRVFPNAGSTCRISRAAVVFRNPRLLAAIRADLERARTENPSGRKGTFRLRQADLESMFHGRRPERGPTPPENGRESVAAARRLLAGAGVEEAEIEAIFRFLAAEEPGEGDLVPGVLPGGRDALTAVLDELAFGTSIDLETARESLMAAWVELRAQRRAPALAPRREAPVADVASAVAAFERRRSEGASLDETFRDLERDLGLADEISEDEEDTPAPDFPGVVGAIVEEFLWDEERERGGNVAESDSILRSLGRFGAGIGVFENLTARELTAYACHWVLEQREVADAESAERLLDALDRFCDWAQATQEVPLRDTFGPTVAALRSSLPRLAETNRRFARSGASGLDWMDVVAVEGPAAVRVRGEGGEESVVEVDPAVVAGLRAGDALRGRRTGSNGIAVEGAFPGEIRDLRS